MEVMRNEDAVHSKMKQLREDRSILAEKYPHFLWMKDYINGTLETVIDNEFEFDPNAEADTKSVHSVTSTKRKQQGRPWSFALRFNCQVFGSKSSQKSELPRDQTAIQR